MGLFKKLFHRRGAKISTSSMDLAMALFQHMVEEGVLGPDASTKDDKTKRLVLRALALCQEETAKIVREHRIPHEAEIIRRGVSRLKAELQA